jgi:hypothetical protein
MAGATRHRPGRLCALLEHLWFKRTADHDTRTLARREAMGGRVNAYTAGDLGAPWPGAYEDAAELAELFPPCC